MARGQCVVELLEQRALLSAYALNGIADSGVNSTGMLPYAPVIADSDGNLYGTARYGGSFGAGTVYEVVKQSGVITPLASFNISNGASPMGALAMDSAGNLYGTTNGGGPDNDGTIFELPKGSNSIITLAYFNGGNGSLPQAGVIIDASGNLYGTTGGSLGTSATDTIFELPRGSNTIFTLAKANGVGRTNGLTIDSAGNLYATGSGRTGWGEVFELAKGSQVVSDLADFSPSVPGNGYRVVAGVVLDAAGNIYGTTDSGGASGNGTIFEVMRGSGQIIPLASFDSNTVGFSSDWSLLIDGNGNLYGITANGNSTVFELAKGSSTITVLDSLPFPTLPEAGLFADADGNLFGTDAANVTGSVFEVARPGNTFSKVVSFSGSNTNQSGPGVVLDSFGDLYTTTQAGGTSGNGSIIEIAKGSSTITTLASFDGSNGKIPDSLLIDGSGNLYGTTSSSKGGSGTVFELPYGSGVITTIATNVSSPYGLTRDSNGNLFGVNLGGGSIFEIPAGSNTATLLAKLNFTMSGMASDGPLALDGNGDLFGTSALNGVLYELPKGSSTVVTVASFKGVFGSQLPYGGVVFDNLGNMFGTVEKGGANLEGSVYEISAGSQTVTTVASFQGNNASAPAAGVTIDSNGDIFGTTSSGGQFGYGTIFEIVKGSGKITPLASFNGANGASPQTGVVLDSSGNIYGDTSGGYTRGTIFSAVPDFQISGTSNATTGDQIYLRAASASTVNYWVNPPTPFDGAPNGTFDITAPGIDVDGLGGPPDTVTIDLSNGPVLPSGSGSVVTSTGGGISVVVEGTAADETLDLNSSGLVTFGGGSAALSNTSSIIYSDGGGNDAVFAAGPIPLTLNVNGGNDTLNVGMSSNATVNIGASGGDLTIDGTGNTTLNITGPGGNVQFGSAADELANSGASATGSISGVIYNDINANGPIEPHDAGLTRRTVFIDWNGNGKLDPGEQTAITDSSGAYQFTGLAAGSYRVRELVPNKWRATTAAVRKITVGSATVGGVDFGQTQAALISGTVFLDRNGDGKPDHGDHSLAGWLVFLDMNHDGRFDKGDVSTTTDSGGHYHFVVAAGGYRVLEVVKKGYRRTAPSANGYRLTLAAGQAVSSVNFANR